MARRKHKALTSERVRRWIEEGADCCPFCGSARVEYGSIDMEGGAWQKADCPDCGAIWHEGHTLDKIMPINEKTGEPLDIVEADEVGNLLERPPCDWQKATDAIQPLVRDALARRMMGVAEQAAMLARYLDTRSGGAAHQDQGHAAAVKAANKVAGLLHVKGFGYNEYSPFSF